MRSLHHLSIRYKFGIIPFLFVVIFALSLYVIYSSQAQQKADAELVNLAGRQRMLSQKIAFLAERLSHGDIEVSGQLAAAVKLCDESLLVLEQGGVPEGLSGSAIPPAPPVLTDQISEVTLLWNSYKESAEQIVDGDHLAIETIEQEAGAMLASFNGLVQSFVKLNEQKQSDQGRLLWLLMGLAVATAMASVLLMNSVLVKRILALTGRLKLLSTCLLYTSPSPRD